MWTKQQPQTESVSPGTEDLQIDGKVDGPISLRGHELTVGRTAELTSEIHARGVVVYGKVTGNLHARDRVDVKSDGSVIGDISTARISIEDGAQFKGRIEIDPTKSQNAAADEPVTNGSQLLRRTGAVRHLLTAGL